MTLAGMMVRDWGITNNKEMNRRMEKKGKRKTRAKDEGGCLMHVDRTTCAKWFVWGSYGIMDRGNIKRFAFLPPLADPE
jgi:hypothetical protein